jgi:hypothetical protein
MVDQNFHSGKGPMHGYGNAFGHGNIMFRERKACLPGR